MFHSHMSTYTSFFAYRIINNANETKYTHAHNNKINKITKSRLFLSRKWIKKETNSSSRIQSTFFKKNDALKLLHSNFIFFFFFFDNSHFLSCLIELLATFRLMILLLEFIAVEGLIARRRHLIIHRKNRRVFNFSFILYEVGSQNLLRIMSNKILLWLAGQLTPHTEIDFSCWMLVIYSRSKS